MSFTKAIATFKLNEEVNGSVLGEEKRLELDEVIREQRAFSEERDARAEGRGLMSKEGKTVPEAQDAAELSPQEQVKAAEAVVDAAICCQGLGSAIEISEETRSFLIDAVLNDPSLTPRLFTEDFHHFMRL